ncbi:MAG: hypothetical protein JSS49_15880 [Planctomycetes bacterium]|nr:hypothetical protein [Planctomycetota bacterium]
MKYERRLSPVAILLLLLLSTTTACGDDGDDLLKKLGAIDEVYRRSVEASGTVNSIFAHDPKLNRLITFHYTMIDGRQAIEEIEPKPKFQKEVSDATAFGGSFRLDDSGRMNVVSSTSSVFLFDKDLCGESVTNSALQVDSANSVSERDKSYSIWQYPPDNTKNMYYSLRLQFSMGRGFSPYITAVESVSPEDSPHGAALRVDAIGSCISSAQGKWNLLVVPGDSYLVREASFTIDGASEPLFSVSNSDRLQEGDLLIARNARFQLGPNSIGAVYEVATTSASMTGNVELLKLVRDRVSDNLPAHSFVEDRRTDPPRTYRIDEEGQIRGDSAASVEGEAVRPEPRPLAKKPGFQFLIFMNVAIIAVIVIAYGVSKWRNAKK